MRAISMPSSTRSHAPYCLIIRDLFAPDMLAMCPLLSLGGKFLPNQTHRFPGELSSEIAISCASCVAHSLNTFSIAPFYGQVRNQGDLGEAGEYIARIE